MFHLELRTAGKLMIERQERGVTRFVKRNNTYLDQHPSTLQATEIILTDSLFIEENLLDNSLIDRCILDYLHMMLAIKKLRIVALAHKEMFHLPLRTVDSLNLTISHHTQREKDTLHLKLAIGRKIEHKIIE